MRKRSSWVGLVVSLALVVVMTVGTISAQASIYRVGKFDIYYYGYTQKTWARGLAAYVPEAWRAAYTVIGNRTLNGQMQVRFYSTRNNTLGYMWSGTQKIYLNRYKFSSYATWGGTLAYETSHVLFYNYTKAASWNRDKRMLNYTTWITESLARYTSDVAYRYGPRETPPNVKEYLNMWMSPFFPAGKFTPISFYDMGYYYRNGRGYLRQTAIYGQKATGYFLTGGRTFSTHRNVARLMYYMRVYSSDAGRYLRSSNYNTARNYFEYTFQRATGYRANAGLIYGRINNTKYLMGQFYNKWYWEW